MKKRGTILEDRVDKSEKRFQIDTILQTERLRVRVCVVGQNEEK